MTDSNTITCPECETDQPKTAPFCQNCGFRMRSPKTVQEPMMALTPERVEELEAMGSGGDAGETSGPGETGGPATMIEQPAPEKKKGRPSRRIVGGSDSDTKEQKSEESTDSMPPMERSTDTLVEGVRAISRDEPYVEDGEDPALDEEPEATSEEGRITSKQPAAPLRAPVEKRRGQLRFVIGASLATCLAIVAGLSWLHLERQSASDEATASASAEYEVIDVEAGHFRRGLAEDAKAFILEFCHRYHDDVDRECDRDYLLDGEFPEQTVNMPAFGIDSIAVRNADYQDCVDAGDCQAIDFDGCDVWTPKGLQIGVRVPQILRRDDHPAVCVDRQRASDYCEWQGGELPSHNQWEKAARGDQSTLFPWGDHWEPDLANWGERDIMRTSVAGELDGFAWTAPPGAFPDGQSPYGLEDMAGNVAEWVRGNDPLEGHVRGGSWISNPFELRTTARKKLDAAATRTDVGFRCVY